MFLVKLNDGVTLPEVFWRALRLTNPCFHTGARSCVLGCEECPPSSMCVLWHEMTHRLLSPVAVSLSANPFRFGSKGLERGRRIWLPLEAILDSWAQHSHGIKLWGQERSVLCGQLAQKCHLLQHVLHESSDCLTYPTLIQSRCLLLKQTLKMICKWNRTIRKQEAVFV